MNRRYGGTMTALNKTICRRRTSFVRTAAAMNWRKNVVYVETGEVINHENMDIRRNKSSD